MNKKKPVLLTVIAAFSFPLIASCSAGGTTIKAAPETLAPIVEAVTSSTFSAWESASSVFSSASAGDKKWSALKSQQKSIIENGDTEPLYYWTSEEKDGWEILKFCSDAIVEKECSEFDKVSEIHVQMVDGKATDLLWFEDAEDEISEVLFYQIASANPEFGAADFVIESAITKKNSSGKESTCYFGQIEMDSQVSNIVDELYLAVRLYVKAESTDGVMLEASSGTSGIIDTSRVDKPTPFVACYEYPATQIEQLTIEAGQFRLEVLDRTTRNTSDIAISLKPSKL